MNNITCIKTGCQVYLSEWDEYVYGDAFEGDDFFVFNVVARSFQPINVAVRHFTVRLTAHWWNQTLTGQNSPSVILAYAQHVVNHGYKGVEDSFLREDGSQRINP